MTNYGMQPLDSTGPFNIGAMYKPRRLVVATPAHHGYHDNFYGSMLGLQKLCLERGIPMEPSRLIGHSSIAHARTTMMRDFLYKTDGTDLIFIDSDQGFDPQDVLDMVESDLPIVGAVCCQKKYDWEAIQRAARQASLAPHPQPDALALAGAVFTFDTGAAGNDVDLTERKAVPVRRVGFGLTVIKRVVIETLAARGTPKVELAGGPDFPPLCNTRVVQSADRPGKWEWLTEDYAFCSRAADVGFKTYLAWWTKTTHTGDHVFKADLVTAAEMLGGVSQDQRDSE